MKLNVEFCYAVCASLVVRLRELVEELLQRVRGFFFAMATNIDYKQLGISDKANEFFEIYRDFQAFSERVSKYVKENEVWLDAISVCDNNSTFYSFVGDIENVEINLRHTVRVVWNFETKSLF